jgi:hypothetical protein
MFAAVAANPENGGMTDAHHMTPRFRSLLPECAR